MSGVESDPNVELFDKLMLDELWVVENLGLWIVISGGEIRVKGENRMGVIAGAKGLLKDQEVLLVQVTNDKK